MVPQSDFVDMFRFWSLSVSFCLNYLQYTYSIFMSYELQNEGSWPLLFHTCSLPHFFFLYDLFRFLIMTFCSLWLGSFTSCLEKILHSRIIEKSPILILDLHDFLLYSLWCMWYIFSIIKVRRLLLLSKVRWHRVCWSQGAWSRVLLLWDLV